MTDQLTYCPQHQDDQGHCSFQTYSVVKEWVWSRSAIKEEIKLKVCQAAIILRLLYGCETLVVCQHHARKCNHLHLSCQRNQRGSVDRTEFLALKSSAGPIFQVSRPCSVRSNFDGPVLWPKWPVQDCQRSFSLWNWQTSTVPKTATVTPWKHCLRLTSNTWNMRNNPSLRTGEDPVLCRRGNAAPASQGFTSCLTCPACYRAFQAWTGLHSYPPKPTNLRRATGRRWAECVP